MMGRGLPYLEFLNTLYNELEPREKIQPKNEREVEELFDFGDEVDNSVANIAAHKGERKGISVCLVHEDSDFEEIDGDMRQQGVKVLRLENYLDP